MCCTPVGDRGRLGHFVLAVLITLFLLATVTPRGALPRWVVNGVVQEAGFATFPAPGLLRSVDAPPWLGAAIAAERLRIELEVIPRQSEQSGPARIFTVSVDPYLRNLTIAQEGQDLIVRVRRPGASANGTPAFVVADVFEGQRSVRIEAALDAAGLSIDVDGDRRLSAPWPTVSPFPQWDPAYPVALGNELTWNRPWFGTVTTATLEAGGATVDLLAPDTLTAPFGGSTAPPFAWFASSPLDLALNFLLMIPMGILTVWAAGVRSVRRAVLIWAPVVVLAETVQFFLPGRFPALSDVILNLVGVLAGSALAMRWLAAERTATGR